MNDFENMNHGIVLLFCVGFPVVIIAMAVAYMIRKPDHDSGTRDEPQPKKDGTGEPAPQTKPDDQAK